MAWGSHPEQQGRRGQGTSTIVWLPTPTSSSAQSTPGSRGVHALSILPNRHADTPAGELPDANRTGVMVADFTRVGRMLSVTAKLAGDNLPPLRRQQTLNSCGGSSTG